MRARNVWIVALAVLGSAAAPLPPPPGFSIGIVTLPGSAQRIAAGDLDADGDTDLLVLSTGTAMIPLTVLVNGPGHSFVPGWSASLAAVTPNKPADLDLGDVDLDGDLDAIASIPYALNQVRFNAGDASFASSVFLPTSSPRVQNSLGLLDGDAILDIAAFDIDIGGYVGGHKGLGTGFFGEQNFKFVGGADFATRAELGDVTGDGVKDLVRASVAGLQYTKGVAAPGFPGWGADVLVWGDAAVDVALADVDADGRLDAVVTIPLSNAIEVFHGVPGGLGLPNPFPGGPKPGPLALADMDNDGLLDVVVANGIGATITVNSGSVGGVFLDLQRFRGGPGCTDILASDLDGDGDQDLAETLADGRVALLFNKLVP